VVNNGSEDETDSILKELASDNRVNVVSLEKNLGVSGGRNAGLAQAAGDFICFLDADDRLTPESLEARMKVMKTRPEVSFVDGGVRKIDPIGNELSLEQPRFEGAPFDELLSLSGSCFIGITWLIRKKEGVVYRFNSEIKHGEDLLFFLSIAHSGVYTAIDSRIYEYLMRPGSAMSDLKGLEKGYQTLEDELGTWNQVTTGQLSQFRKRWKKIMVKSYLKAGKINEALRLRVS